MPRQKTDTRSATAVLVPVLLAATAIRLAAGDQPQWGERYSRNMVSDEVNLPATFDPETGLNIGWIADLGTQSHSTPIVARGRVLVGTNNERPRDARHEGDRGVLLCLDEATGKLVWQLVVPKIEYDEFRDWPRVGIVSPPTVEGDRVYVVSNRGEVLCLDLDGHADGNDGPFRDEGRYMAPDGSPPLEVRSVDADIIWKYDTVEKHGVRLHDEAHASVLIHGDFLYLPSSNGVDGTHKYVPSPQAPSLIVLEKRRGRLVAIDDLKIGPEIVHCTWSSPSLGVVDGRELIFFAGSNAICYAFEALKTVPPPGKTSDLKRVWRFDCDPLGPRGDLLKYQDNRRVGPSTIIGMPVFEGGRIYVTAGGDLWHGKLNCWLKCIDATKTGELTGTGELWSRPLKRHCMSTPSVKDGLVYIADCGRQVSCFDAKTGEPQWVHQARGDIWGSTMVADGRVYVGSRRGDFWILAAGRTKKVLAEVRLHSPISGTSTVANGVLYITTMDKLYAIREDAE